MQHHAMEILSPSLLSSTVSGTGTSLSMASSTASSAWVMEAFAQVHAPAVGQVWLAHRGALQTPEAQDWLQAVGGLPLEELRNETELMVMADSAPNELLFGLIYGKLRDLLAASYTASSFSHPIVLPFGERSKVMSFLYDSVMLRGDRLSVMSEVAHPEFCDELAVGHSRDERARLLAQAAAAPNAFLLGQLTSWLITNHRAHYPDLYPQAQAWFERDASRAAGLRTALLPS